MNKRRIVLVLAVSFVLVCLSACGSGNTDKKQSDAETALTDAVQADTAEKEENQGEKTGLNAVTQEQAEADLSNVEIDYGTSALYTIEELEQAADLVKNDFSSWKGCTLYRLYYAGDEQSRQGLDLLNALGEKTDYEQAAAFFGDFRSPKDSTHWESDKEYRDYQWWLAKTTNGSWELVLHNEDAATSGLAVSDRTEESTTADKTDAELLKEGLSVSPMNMTAVCEAEDGVNVRAGCSKESTILGMLGDGTQVKITGKVTKDGMDYGWYQIEYNGQTAYVIADFFR